MTAANEHRLGVDVIEHTFRLREAGCLSIQIPIDRSPADMLVARKSGGHNRQQTEGHEARAEPNWTVVARGVSRPGIHATSLQVCAMRTRSR
jgi:hypothetical protein